MLRTLRARGVTVRALLCADLDDDQTAYLLGTLQPLEIVPSHESLARTAQRMRAAEVGR